MNKLISCGPLKLERLFIWTRGHSNRDAQRCQLLENDEQGGVIVVQLVKGKSQSLGLTISGGTDKASPPYVANVRSGGLADESDYFSVGDLILEINEKDVTRLKHSEIIKFIQEAGKKLCFKMQYKKLPGEAIVKSTTLNLCKEHNEMKFTLRGSYLLFASIFINSVIYHLRLSRFLMYLCLKHVNILCVLQCCMKECRHGMLWILETHQRTNLYGLMGVGLCKCYQIALSC